MLSNGLALANPFLKDYVNFNLSISFDSKGDNLINVKAILKKYFLNITINLYVLLSLCKIDV